jgi:photosystem II stability/assembly factor-like uncharacterized protein
LAVDPQNPNILYAQVAPYPNGPALFKSVDGGKSWSSFPTPAPGLYFAIDPQNSDTIYAGGPGVLKSTNGGMSWSTVMDGVIAGYWAPVKALLIDPQNPATVYAGTSQGLYRSTDGGISWSTVGANMPRRLSISGLAIDPQDSSKIYAATSGGGVFATFASPVLTLDRAVYCVGDSWKLNVSNAAPALTVRLIETSNGQAWEVFQWQMTDVDGDNEQVGTLSQDTQGNHTLRVEAGGMTSNAVSFVVSNCAPGARGGF